MGIKFKCPHEQEDAGASSTIKPKFHSMIFNLGAVLSMKLDTHTLGTLGESDERLHYGYSHVGETLVQEGAMADGVICSNRARQQQGIFQA